MQFDDLKKRISRLYQKPDASAGDYIAIANDLNDWRENAPEYMRSAKVAFLSSFNIDKLADIFGARALFHNLLVKTYVPNYNQFSQEIYDKNSELYSFNPDITFVLVDTPDVADVAHLTSLVEAYTANCKAKLVFANFVTSPKQTSQKICDALNKKLDNLVSIHASLDIFDLNTFLNLHNKEKVWYTKYTDLGDMRIAPQVFSLVSEPLLGFVIALSGATKKCLVLDLDNTIWNGVIGEDGINGIVPNTQLQKYILKLHSTGTVLAVNSKNNEGDAFEAITQHPAMLIRKHHLTAWRINWQNKAQNMAELANELKLGIDSFVFLDDSAFEKELIIETFPEVAVVPIDYFSHYAGFSLGVQTKEDTQRNKMYKEENDRKKFFSSVKNLNDYLHELKLEISITDVTDATVSRASQLTQKTNQFNLTTQRYSESDITDMLFNGSKAWVMSANDKFGDYGIIGVGIIAPKDSCWIIDTFLLSCRIIGRGVENAFLAHIAKLAKNSNITMIKGIYKPTKKNKPCENFYIDAGFKLESATASQNLFIFDLKKTFTSPKHIKINTT